MKAVYLKITSYLVGIHYYGELEGSHLSDPVKLERSLEAEEAERWSYNDGFDWEAGDLTERFNSERHLIEAGRSVFFDRELGDLLMLGRQVYCFPQYVLEGRLEVKVAINNLVLLYQEIQDSVTSGDLKVVVDEYDRLVRKYEID